MVRYTLKQRAIEMIIKITIGTAVFILIGMMLAGLMGCANQEELMNAPFKGMQSAVTANPDERTSFDFSAVLCHYPAAMALLPSGTYVFPSTISVSTGAVLMLNGKVIGHYVNGTLIDGSGFEVGLGSNSAFAFILTDDVNTVTCGLQVDFQLTRN